MVLPQRLQQEIDRLLRLPGAGRLLGAASRLGKTRIDEAGNEQMGAHPAIVPVAQIMRPGPP